MQRAAEGPSDDGLGQEGQLAGALAWYRALPFSAGSSLPSSLPSSSVPTTYAWGRRDFALKRRAAELTARHVDGPYRFEVLDAGHWLPERRPKQVAELVLERVRG